MIRSHSFRFPLIALLPTLFLALVVPNALFAQDELIIIPTVDAMVDFSSGGPYLVTGDVSIVLQDSTFVDIDNRGVLEFDIGPVPDGATITSATLELDLRLLSSSEDDRPVLYLHGYAGNGTAEITDAQIPANLIGQSAPILSLGTVSMAIDTSYITSLLTATDYLGLLLLNEENGTQAGFATTEGEQIALGTAPVLTIHYTEPLIFTEIGLAIQGVSTGEVAWGDYDNDGDQDLAIVGTWHDGSWKEMAKVYRNDTGDVFTDIGATVQGVKGTCAWGDYDNDSNLDLGATGYMGGGRWLIRIHKNHGNDVFANISAGLPEAEGKSMEWSDYDNDGDLDLAVTGGWWDRVNQPGTKLFQNDGAGVFADTNINLVDVNSSQLAWGDSDNDGDVDLVLAGNDGLGNRVGKLYRNDGNGILTDIPTSITPVRGCDLKWSDYDNDGDLDLAVAGDSASGIVSTIYRNDGGNTFVDSGAGLTGVSSCCLAWGDYDNDGDADLLSSGVADSGYVTILYRNDGSDTFTAVDAGLPGLAGCSLAWGDYDNDTDLDLAVLGLSDAGRISRIYRNDVNILNTPPMTPSALSANRDSDAITFSWNAAFDNQTPINGLSYNLRVGTTPGGEDIFSGMADLSTGYRRIPRLSQFPLKLGGLDNFSSILRCALICHNAFLQ